MGRLCRARFLLLFFRKDGLFLLSAVMLCAAAPRHNHSDPTEQHRQATEQHREAMEQQRQAAVAKRDLAAARAQEAALADQRAKAAAELRAVEADVLAATDRLAAAGAAQAKADAALAAHEAAFSQLIPLMLRLSRYPAETVLAVPASPERAMEGLLVTRGLAMEWNREAGALRAQQAQAASLRAETVRQQAALTAERARQQARAAGLDRLEQEASAQVSAAEQADRDAAASVAALAAQATSLRGALTTVDRGPASRGQTEAPQDKGTRPGGPALSKSVGRLVTPVAGQVLRAFGSAGDDGPATGVTYGTAPGAFVASPCTGRIGFAALFRSYGQLVILECGGGYDVVLAGLGRIDAAPGHKVRPGEPVGRMPDNGGAAGAFRPHLYVELRANGQPVNPAPFLAAAPE